MRSKLKLIGIAAIVAVGLASPAFAQRAHDPGVNAYDMVGPLGSGFGPVDNGGGSVGYNSDIGKKTD